MKTGRTAALDASALLALLNFEPGAEQVAELLPESVMSTVNLSEVFSHGALRGDDPRPVLAMVLKAGLLLVEFTAEDALAAAELAPATRKKGLSLGDRACLVLASRLGLTAVTADRLWSQVDLPVEIRVIR